MQQVESISFKQYIGNIIDAVRTTVKGLSITIKYVYSEKPVTIEYPDVKEVLPDNARQRLYNDVVNCISCNACATACPVDCIYIASEQRPKDEEAPKTADGTMKRRVLTQYVIDTALCCYCGLCTTVCPTECLTHSKDYEFSQYSVDEMKYDYLTDELIAWRDRIVK
jgi:NADH-quinone oxidoreductase subunit I